MSKFSINRIKDLLNDVFTETDLQVCSIDIKQDKNLVIKITYSFSSNLALSDCQIIKDNLDSFVSSHFKLNHISIFNNSGAC